MISNGLNVICVRTCVYLSGKWPFRVKWGLRRLKLTWHNVTHKSTFCSHSVSFEILIIIISLEIIGLDAMAKNKTDKVAGCISPALEADPTNLIATKVCEVGPLANIIYFVKFDFDVLRGSKIYRIVHILALSQRQSG